MGRKEKRTLVLAESLLELGEREVDGRGDGAEDNLVRLADVYNRRARVSGRFPRNREGKIENLPRIKTDCTD